MSFIALEISLNDELIYTVGTEEWRHMEAAVRAIRWPAEFIEKLESSEDTEQPERELEHIHLHAHVSVPNETDSAATNPSGGQFQTGSFDVKNLAVGDVVTIKVIESDFGDEPTWRNPDDGMIAIRSKD